MLVGRRYAAPPVCLPLVAVHRPLILGFESLSISTVLRRDTQHLTGGVKKQLL